MATVARLLPRYWDGRRLLQFLTGLALIALAFAVPTLQDPADQPAESPVTIITTVDTPLPGGLPVTDAPAGTDKTNLALTPEASAADPAAGSPADVGRSEAAAQSAAALQGGQDGAYGSASAPGVAGLPGQAWHGGRRICFEGRAAGGDAAQGAHGERGPPGV